MRQSVEERLRAARERIVDTKGLEDKLKAKSIVQNEELKKNIKNTLENFNSNIIKNIK